METPDFVGLLLALRACKRCEGKHMIIVQSGFSASGGYYEQFAPCPDCRQKVKEFADVCYRHGSVAAALHQEGD